MFKHSGDWTVCNLFYQPYINTSAPALITTLIHIPAHDLTISAAPL